MLSRNIFKRFNYYLFAKLAKCNVTNLISPPSELLNPGLVELMQDFRLSDYQVQKVYDLLTEQMNMGLKKDTVAKSDIKCLITHVHHLPTGQEVGKYLALDLGGTNFRVLLLNLKGPEEAEVSSETFQLTKENYTGPGDKLFDFIAQCLYKFAKQHNVENAGLPIGFTFSFPCLQSCLEKAKLVQWTKGFSSPGVVGQDVGRLLREAMARQPKMKVGHIAILNDTTGTLMSCAYETRNCRIGLIIGTGCNACYLERIENTDKLDKRDCEGHSHVVINTEWGAFGNGGYLEFIRSDLDRQIDAPTPNAGFQVYEKLIAGMYLGGLVRLNLYRAIEKGFLFQNHPDKKRLLDFLEHNPDCFPTRYLSQIESDESDDHQAERSIIKELFHIHDYSAEDCEGIYYICDTISIRAARLAGVGLANLVNRINEPYTVIAIDGSVYRHHGKFDWFIRRQMRKMVKLGLQFEIMLSEDGSGKGAALVAAVTEEVRLKK